MKFFLIALLFIAGCSAAPKSEFETKYKNELTRARELLQDSRSKNVFDKMLELLAYERFNDQQFVKDLIIQGQFKPVDIAGFRTYFHPLVPINAGDIVIDAGIALTAYPLFEFSKLVGPDGKVIAFDPDPEVVSLILKKIEQRQIENVEIHELGLFDKEGTMTLYMHYNPIIREHGGNTLFGYEGSHDTLNIEVVRLDYFVEKHNIPRVDFVKMNIEGSELPALKGMENVLRKHKPSLAMSIYDKPKYLFEIILWLNSLGLGYEFWLDSHESTHHGKILYAKAKQ